MNYEEYLSNKITPEVRREIKKLISSGESLFEMFEESFLSTINPKNRQKIEELRASKAFKKRTLGLKKKWSGLIKSFILLTKRVEPSYGKLEVVNEKIQYTPEIINELKKFQIILDNEDFNKDLLELARESKLFPLEQWKNTISGYLLTNFFVPFNYFLNLDLARYASSKEIPKNLNFIPKIIENEKTKEKELSIQIFEGTSLQEIKNNWNYINTLQKILKKEKGISKRYYPLKNLELAKKLLTKKKKSDYYEPTTNKWEKVKETDIMTAEEILGEVPLEDIEKVKNNLKQIRHKYRKRLNS